MTVMESHCSRCGSSVEVAVGERVFNGNIVWFRSYQCQACGNQVEEDGRGTPPGEIRESLLEQDGEWSLVLAGSDDPAVLKALRQSLHLSITEAADLRKRLPGALFRGTKAEVERLVSLLRNEGVQSQRVRVDK